MTTARLTHLGGMLERSLLLRGIAAITASTLVALGLFGSAGAAQAGKQPDAPAAGTSAASPGVSRENSDNSGAGENMPAEEDPIVLPAGNPLWTVLPTARPETAQPDSESAADAPFIEGPPAATSVDPSTATSEDPSASATTPHSAIASSTTPSNASRIGPMFVGSGDGTNANLINTFDGASRVPKTVTNTNPPDTQLAVGPSYVAEMVNGELDVYTRVGGQVGASILLPTLFGQGDALLNTIGGEPHDWKNIADPKILYDTASGRFFATEMVYNDARNDGSIKLVVSAPDDPTHWGKPMIAAYTTNHVLLDQPKLAVNDDKVTITADPCSAAFLSPGCGEDPLRNFHGGATYVVDKAQAIAGTLQQIDAFTNDAYEPIPAIQLSPQGRQYEFYYFKDSFGRSFLQEQYLTGSPATHDLKRITPPGVRIHDTTSPPNAKQPGTKVKLDTGDDRIGSAVYRDGIVWLSSNDKCKKLACLRLIQLNVDSSTKSQAPSASYDVRYSRPGLYSFYPAVTMDGNHDLIVSFSVASPTVYPSASELSLANGASFANVIPQDYHVGTGSLAGDGKPERFGDYSGAAPDPLYAGNVWVAAELGAGTSSEPGRWSTAIAQYSFRPPSNYY